MIHSKTHLEITLNERKYELICDPTSPLGELHDVICQFKTEVVNRIKEVLEEENKASEKKDESNDG